MRSNVSRYINDMWRSSKRRTMIVPSPKKKVITEEKIRKPEIKKKPEMK